MRTALLCLLALPSPTLACLNDRETIILEQEFRSRYESPATPDLPLSNADPSKLPSFTTWHLDAAGISTVGILLLLASHTLSRRNTPK